MTETLTRAGLTEAVYREVGLSQAESSELVDEVFEAIITALENDESVKLSSFGTFHVRKKNARVGRNPKTKVEVPIAPRRVISFKASNKLIDKVNGE